MRQTVLVAGATGVLGGRIIHYLLAEPHTTVRMLVRANALADSAKQAFLSSLLHRGAELIAGDLTDSFSLQQAAMGIDVIISAVEGGSEVITGGQIALLEAGKHTGVRRFIPSNFALDFFNAPTGEYEPFDLRRRVDDVIKRSGLEFLNVLNGVLMDNLVAPNSVIDLETHIVKLWGIGNEPFAATSIEDVARYTAKAALDRGVPNGKFAIAGEVLSFDTVSETLGRALGRAFERKHLGSIADLKTYIQNLRAEDRQKRTAIMSQLYLLTGQTALENLQNSRYPDVRPESFADFVHRKLGSLRGRNGVSET